ncbi:MAG: AAA family ATPase [Ilumatobacter sp.]
MSSDLFSAAGDVRREGLAPLAERMRPRTLDELMGQDRLAGDQGSLRRQLAAGHVPNMVLQGPPGTGKTTIARLVASETGMAVEELSAVAAGLADVRRVVSEARARLGGAHGGESRQTVLFLDEIHRFNRAQQDALLPSVEDGTIRLVGATTENPYVSINRALLSRCVVYKLEPIPRAVLAGLLIAAAADSGRGLSRSRSVTVADDAIELVLDRTGGDARRALTLLEAAALLAGTGSIEASHVAEASDARSVRYDRAGDEHYDHASAYIKSMRAGNADDAIRWLAQMLEGGEDPLFIARRLAIFAAEDVGNAKPNALVLATAAQQHVDAVGMPECRIALAQVTRYCAEAPKSRQAFDDIERALAAVRDQGTSTVPSELTNREAPPRP